MENKKIENRTVVETNPNISIAHILPLATAIIPLLALVGGLTGYTQLSSLGSQSIPMAPSTSFSFLLVIIVMLMLMQPVKNQPTRWINSIITGLVSFHAFLVLLSLTGLPTNPDTWFISNPGTALGYPIGIMSPSTALLFLVAGITLLFMILKPGFQKQTLPWYLRPIFWSGIILFLAAVFVLGYMIGLPLLYGSAVIPMALPTAITFLLLGASLLIITNPDLGANRNWIRLSKNIKVSTLLKLGFAFIITFVIVIGVIAWAQTDAIAGKTSELYNHPQQVRRAIGKFTADILTIHLDMHDLMLSHSDAEIEAGVGSMNTLQADAMDQLTILESQYLGPQADVDQVRQEFIKENSARVETIRLLRAGQTEATARLLPGGAEDKQAQVVLTALNKIDVFAKAKGEEIFANSQQLTGELHNQLLSLLIVILISTLVILYFLQRSIRQPLDEMMSVTQAFKNGDLQARITYNSKNEFGLLSDSVNQLAETIQLDLQLKEKTANLSSLMLSTNEAVAFFQATLSALAEYSGSQMAAVYLLSSDRKTFDHFTSIGLDEVARASFAADSFDGEFGAALATKKIQHIASIPDDTRFSFYTVGCSFTPREIITIPIFSDHQIMAVISLASLHPYSPQSLRQVNAIWSTLNARITGILAYRQTQLLAKQLECQNSDLEAQKNELTAQAAELNHQNLELEAQKIQLGEASRLKTSFISNMSHELRTPLNSVIALSGVLYRRLANQIPQEEHSYLAVIERNGKQLLELINDILDLSRIEAGREETEITRFEMNALISEVVSIIEPMARQKNIALINNPTPEPILIQSDVSKCRHILQNLVNNAVKFTETGKVEIAIQRINDSIQIAVCDTGIGISAENIPLIFDEFRQVDSSTSRRYGGSGLGLAIAKKYTQMLGGSIAVESSPGHGSVFTLSLPIKIIPGSFANQEAFEISKLPGKSGNPDFSSGWNAPERSQETPDQKTLIVVEDSEPAVIQLKDILEEQGYHILVARNGSEALEMIRHTLPDAMILDLMMPGIDGFEVLRTIREMEGRSHLPVLILTAKYISQEELKFLKHNHVSQLIQKGDINRAELLNAVAGMVTPTRAETVEKPKPIPPPIEGKPVVLVVEDNPDNMLTVKAILADHFTVIEAADGLVAVEQARQRQPHLILMDIALPLMDGIQAFKALRNDPHTQQIPVIALTASAMTTDRETILSYGFDGYIAKPIDQIEFFHTIQQVLYGKE